MNFLKGEILKLTKQILDLIDKRRKYDIKQNREIIQ